MTTETPAATADQAPDTANAVPAAPTPPTQRRQQLPLAYRAGILIGRLIQALTVTIVFGPLLVAGLKLFGVEGFVALGYAAIFSPYLLIVVAAIIYSLAFHATFAATTQVMTQRDMLAAQYYQQQQALAAAAAKSAPAVSKNYKRRRAH